MLDSLNSEDEMHLSVLCWYPFVETLDEHLQQTVLDLGPFHCNGTIIDPSRTLRLRELPNMWCCRWHNRGTHDFFVNYRVRTDAPHAEKLCLMLENEYIVDQAHRRRVRVFWDQHCLPFGQNWEDGFLYGLTQSKVIVLVVSSQGLDPTKRADTRQDNVLLEYEYALDGLDKRTHEIFVVFVEDQGKESVKLPNLEDFPDKKHLSPRSTHPTVRSTIRRIYDLRSSESAIELRPEDLELAVSRLMNVAERYSDLSPCALSRSHTLNYSGLQFSWGGSVAMSAPSRPVRAIECFLQRPKNIEVSSIILSTPKKDWKKTGRLVLMLTGAGKPRLLAKDKDGKTLVDFQAEVNLNTGVVEQLCFTFDGTEFSFFFNGVKIQNYWKACGELPLTRLLLGNQKKTTSTSKNLIGFLKAFKLWSEPNRNEKSLLCYYSFGEDKGTLVKDESSYKSHGKVFKSIRGSLNWVKDSHLPICRYHKHQRHPVFILYRHSDEKATDLANRLALRLDALVLWSSTYSSPCSAYFAHCHVPGNDQLCHQALQQAIMILVVVTPESLLGFANAHLQEDTMLLEIELCLEQAKQQLAKVVPLLLYDSTEQGFRFDLLPKVQQQPHASARSVAASQGMTIKQTFDNFFKLNGVQIQAHQIKERVRELKDLLEIEMMGKESSVILQNTRKYFT
eukprot:Lithocolla_globosa_v1_NODE_222_length_5054_cov_15.686337.p1 type:complete len:676 gc:universal NODE_222_length_5054_cov_15.686337:3465-1438(-)